MKSGKAGSVKIRRLFVPTSNDNRSSSRENACASNKLLLLLYAAAAVISQLSSGWDNIKQGANSGKAK